MTLKVLGNLNRGLLFVLSAPAGTGKTTLMHMLADEFDCVVQSISCTTRAPRQGEIHGKNYHFLSKEEFEAKIAAQEFIEYVQLYGYYYGTSKHWVEDQLQKGRHVVLVIDTQGAMLLKERCQAVYIFIAPPSLEVLSQRLTLRNTETAEHIATRLSIAHDEIAASYAYDYRIVNDDLAVAYQVLRSIIIAEEHRVLPPKEESISWKQ